MERAAAGTIGLEPADVVPTDVEPEAQRTRGGSRGWLLAAVAGLVALLLGALALWGSRDEEPAVPSTTVSTTTAPPTTTVPNPTAATGEGAWAPAGQLPLMCGRCVGVRLDDGRIVIAGHQSMH